MANVCTPNSALANARNGGAIDGRREGQEGGEEKSFSFLFVQHGKKETCPEKEIKEHPRKFSKDLK